MLLLTLLAAGAPLVLIPGPAGVALSAVIAGVALWANHRLEQSVQRLPARVGPESMRGQSALVVEPLDPVGTVRCGGESWKAVEILGQRVDRGQTVRVVRVRGLQLEVEVVEQGRA